MMFKTVPQFEITVSNQGRPSAREACRYFAVEKLFQTHWFVFEYQLDPIALGSHEPPTWRTLLLADFGAVLDTLEQNQVHLMRYRTSVARHDNQAGWRLCQLDAAFVCEDRGRTAISYQLQDNESFNEPTWDYHLEESAAHVQIYWPAHEYLLMRSDHQVAYDPTGSQE